MSRSAEEQLLLDQRIQEMKQKNEALRRRHMEVEADKQSAAKQNALVRMNVPLDDDWVPGRHVDSPRQERSHQQNDASSLSNPERNDDKGQWSDQRRRNEGRRDDGHSGNRQYEEGASNSRPMQNAPNFSGRRNDYYGNRQKSDGDRSFSNENRRSGDWSNRSNEGSGGRPWEWGPQSNRGYRNNAPSGTGDAARSYPSTFTSKVYKNSSMDQDRGKRPAYRLAEGDGPPPDPSYSFLGDSMRDSPESGERRRGFPRKSFPRGRGRGGQTWNNRNSNDSSNGGEDRGEMQPRHHEDTKHDEWRRERSKIDQERINRQKTSDGNWSREWDSNKVLQEGTDRPHRWRRGNQAQNYGYTQPRRGNPEDAGNTLRQNCVQEGDPAVVPQAGNTSDDADSPSRNKFPRRGRFAHQQRFKENRRFSNGSTQHTPSNEPVTSKQSADAALVETTVKPVEQLEVSTVCDPSGAQVKRSVEGVGGNLRISLSNDGESSDNKNVEPKRTKKSARKGKRNRILSSTSTGTTETGEEDDGSWEDLSSDEDVSVLMELGKVPRSDTAKCVDVSSGPESLDPIPAPGKEDEFLWDDFHPAGFQDNATINLEAEAAYQALLDEKAKQQVVTESDSQGNTPGQPHQVSFRLDTACLEDSSDELEGAKLDPLLVTTQIVQAEVDCMSLTSIPTDTSLPDDVSQFIKAKTEQDDKGTEAAKADPIPVQEVFVSAEELSGPVSILDVPSVEVSTIESNSVDKPSHEEEGRTEPLVAAIEKSSVDQETAVVAKNEVNGENTIVKCESEEKVVDQVKIPEEDASKSDLETLKEVQTNTSDEQITAVETDDCVIEADSPSETINAEKCLAESECESALNSILQKNENDPSTPVDPPLASHGSELESKLDEKENLEKCPQISVSEIVSTNSEIENQEHKIETCDNESKIACEKIDEEQTNSDNSTSQVKDNSASQVKGNSTSQVNDV